MEAPHFTAKGRYPILGPGHPEERSEKKEESLHYNPDDRISPLVNDLLLLIARELPPRDVCRLACTSHKFSAFCTEIWSNPQYNRKEHFIWLLNFLFNTNEAGPLMEQIEKEQNSPISPPSPDFGNAFDAEKMKRRVAYQYITQYSVGTLKTLVGAYRSPNAAASLNKLKTIMKTMLKG